ncbi:hypothetical protein MINTM005_13150 [Mycobacterium intracellulare]|uniref:hypothetical protein n=1 Tax=Mycobacterium intracellulare TaxID=1767 RepID=UPI0019281DE1|nr:hypothetical protein [Mycobacterium intracellulare]BCO56071.1 hypothetical protein MINTM005_13150 [Mycobacterium intracellulare]
MKTMIAGGAMFALTFLTTIWFELLHIPFAAPYTLIAGVEFTAAIVLLVVGFILLLAGD